MRAGLALAVGLLIQILPVQADDCGGFCELPVSPEIDCKPSQLLEQAYPAATHVGTRLLIKGDYAQIVDPDKVVCRDFPDKPDLFVAAIPLIEAHPPGTDRIKGDVEIIVADFATRKPLSRRLEKGIAGSDYITYFQAVEFDASHYEISDGLPAFGIRTSRQGYARLPYPPGYFRWPGPGSERALWLYVYDNEKISRVLDGLIVERTKSAGEYECYADYDSLQRILSVGAESTTGHRDISVKQIVKHDNTRCFEEPGVELNYSNAEEKCSCQVVSLSFPVPDIKLVYTAGKYRLEPGTKLDPGFGDMAKYLMSTWRLDPESAD